MISKGPSVGLLINNSLDRVLLTKFLKQSKFQTTELQLPSIKNTFDLSIIITDEINAERFSSDLLRLKKHAAPIALPVLILIKHNRARIKWLKVGFNEVIQIPIYKIELLAKLKVLQKFREESENQYKLIFETLGIGIYRMDLDHKLLKANPAMLSILGLKNFSEIQNKSLIEQNVTSAEERSEFLNELIKNKSVNHETIWFINGNKIYIKENATLVEDQLNNSYYYHGSIENINAQKQLEIEKNEYQEKLMSSLAEKETLLREVYHRVKNNLQVVSSLLNLQSNSIQDPNSKQLFVESSTRVKAMGLVHELLYRNTDLSKIDINEYMRNLLENLMDVYHTRESGIKTSLQIQPVLLTLDEAIPCGLILNELISNSFKHAFPNGREGLVNLTVKKNDNSIMFQLKDNGIGFNVKEAKNFTSLGLKLVHSLTKQLNGDIEIKSNDGVISTLIFPCKN